MSVVKYSVNLLPVLALLVACNSVGLCVNVSAVFPKRNDEFDAILQLIYLKDTNCSYVDWCTLSGTGSYDFKMHSRNCCTPCSCNDSCLETAECCPDYRLYKLLNGEQHENFSDIVSSVELFRRNKTQNVVLSNYEKSANSSQEALNLECGYLQFLHGSPFYVNGISYKIVTKCPANSTNERLRYLCEEYEQDNHNASLAVLYTPVQTLESGQVYRNKYCFQCSPENQQKYTNWRAVYVIDYRYSFKNAHLYENNNDIFEEIRRYSRSSASSNIIFEPKEGNEALDKKKFCIKEFENVCSVEISDTIRQACMQFSAPVYVRSNVGHSSFITYNNLACLYCNGILENDDKCYGNNVAFMRNLVRLQLTETDIQNASSHEEILEIVFDKTGRCSSGYAFDNSKASCRKIYCPKNHMISDGSCVPVFYQMKDVVYTAILNLTLIRNSNKKRQHKLYSLVMNYIESQEEIDVEHNSMWTSESNTFFIYLSFTTVDKHFGIAEKFIFKLLRLQWIEAMHTELSLKATIGKGPGNVQIDLNSGLVYTTKFPKDPVHITDLFHITRSSFCYRIQVQKDEFVRVGREVFLDTATGRKFIESSEIQYVFNDLSGLPILCADELPHMLVTTGHGFHPSDLSTGRESKDVAGETTIPETNAKDRNLSLSVGVSFGFLFIVFMVFCAIRNSCTRNTSSDTTTGIELDSSR